MSQGTPKMNAVGRTTRPEDTAETSAEFKSLTGGKGLLQYERLIFEKKDYTRTGVDFADIDIAPLDLGDLVRGDDLG